MAAVLLGPARQLQRAQGLLLLLRCLRTVTSTSIRRASALASTHATAPDNFSDAIALGILPPGYVPGVKKMNGRSLQRFAQEQGLERIKVSHFGTRFKWYQPQPASPKLFLWDDRAIYLDRIAPGPLIEICERISEETEALIEWAWEYARKLADYGYAYEERMNRERMQRKVEDRQRRAEEEARHRRIEQRVRDQFESLPGTIKASAPRWHGPQHSSGYLQSLDLDRLVAICEGAVQLSRERTQSGWDMIHLIRSPSYQYSALRESLESGNVERISGLVDYTLAYLHKERQHWAGNGFPIFFNFLENTWTIDLDRLTNKRVRRRERRMQVARLPAGDYAPSHHVRVHLNRPKWEGTDGSKVDLIRHAPDRLIAFGEAVLKRNRESTIRQVSQMLRTIRRRNAQTLRYSVQTPASAPWAPDGSKIPNLDRFWPNQLIEFCQAVLKRNEGVMIHQVRNLFRTIRQRRQRRNQELRSTMRAYAARRQLRNLDRL
jgi:hypothetical protein